MSYTPGPWRVTKMSRDRVWIEGTGRGCGVPRIAIVDDSAGTEPGNANLLAAAPKLLEALEMFIDLADNIETYGAMKSESDWRKVKCVRDVALDAIREARCEE